MKIHDVLKGSHENPYTRATKTTQQQQKCQSATYGFCLDFIDTFVGKCNGAQARRGWRGRGEPRIIIIKEIIRFNNNNHLTRGSPRFLLTRVFFRRAPHPPIVGGVHHLKSPLFPPYPVIPLYVVRTPHPGITDDQAQKRAAKAPAAIHQLLGPIHLCHAQKPYTDGCSVERWRASIKASESPLA